MPAENLRMNKQGEMVLKLILQDYISLMSAYQQGYITDEMLTPIVEGMNNMLETHYPDAELTDSDKYNCQSFVSHPHDALLAYSEGFITREMLEKLLNAMMDMKKEEALQRQKDNKAQEIILKTGLDATLAQHEPKTHAQLEEILERFCTDNSISYRPQPMNVVSRKVTIAPYKTYELEGETFAIVMSHHDIVLYQKKHNGWYTMRAKYSN